MREAEKNLSGCNVRIVKCAMHAEKALVMDFVEEGFKVDDSEMLEFWNIDKTQLVTQLAHLVCACIFDHGFFNADPHPGNVLVQLNEKSAQLCLLDWGWTHRLEKEALDAWRDLAIALPQMDTKAAMAALTRLGYRNSQDERAPERSVQFFQFLFRDT